MSHKKKTRYSEFTQQQSNLCPSMSVTFEPSQWPNAFESPVDQ